MTGVATGFKKLDELCRPEVILAPDPSRLWSGSGYINHWDHKQAGILALTAVMPDAPSRPMFSELLEEGLERACRIGRAMGFDGKWCIHPSQIAIANQVFSPTADEVVNEAPVPSVDDAQVVDATQVGGPAPDDTSAVYLANETSEISHSRCTRNRKKVSSSGRCSTRRSMPSACHFSDATPGCVSGSSMPATFRLLRRNGP